MNWIRSKTLLFIFIVLASFNGLLSCGGSNTSNPDATGAASGYTLNSVAEGGSRYFKAELLEQNPSVKNTGIVLLHGRGGNPNSAVVRQLRKDLYGRGYTTLSIQEPVPSPYTEGTLVPFQAYVDDINGGNYVFPETYARVRTAINALSTEGIKNIVLIGFSMGSRMVSAHMANGIIDELPIIGVIGVGMYGTSIDPLNITSTISAITAPVLDIYGDKDINAVNTAIAHKSAYEGAGMGAKYTQVALICDSGLTTNECHKLVNLKGTNLSQLEVTVAAWIASL